MDAYYKSEHDAKSIYCVRMSRLCCIVLYTRLFHKFLNCCVLIINRVYSIKIAFTFIFVSFALYSNLAIRPNVKKAGNDNKKRRKSRKRSDMKIRVYCLLTYLIHENRSDVFFPYLSSERISTSHASNLSPTHKNTHMFHVHEKDIIVCICSNQIMIMRELEKIDCDYHMPTSQLDPYSRTSNSIEMYNKKVSIALSMSQSNNVIVID